LYERRVKHPVSGGKTHLAIGLHSQPVSTESPKKARV
jgi:hypothetical protein